MDNQQAAMEVFQSIQAHSKAIASEAGVLKRAVTALSRVEGYQNLRHLEHHLRNLESLSLLPGSSLGLAREAASAARLWLEEEWGRRADVFADDLAVYLRDRAIEIGISENGIRMDPFVLCLDPSRDAATLLFSGEPMGKPLAMSCPLVFKAYTDCLSLLERNQTPPENFADELIEAYVETCRWKGLKPGSRVRLSDIQFTLFTRRQSANVRCDPRKGRIKEYPRYQFSWDLGLLMKSTEWMIRSGHSIVIHPAAASAMRSRTDSVRVFVGEGEDKVLGTMQV